MRKHYTEQRSSLVALVTTGRATPRAAGGLCDPIATGGGHLRTAGARDELPSAITLRVAGTEIEVRPGFDRALLHDVIPALAARTQA
jgi:hypothetical protein